MTAAANNQPPIQVLGVRKTFGTNVALADVSLTVAAGEITALIGPSGCGKSTLLRIINGLIRPDAGAVHFEGAALSAANLHTIRRRTGYVIQEGGLFPHLTAHANAALVAREIGWPAQRIAARIVELSQLTRLAPEQLARYPLQLSGGQRQRVSLIRALMLDPAVLLLDEPLGALDPLVRFELQAELREIFRTLRKTVVLVTHDLAEATYFGDRIVLMRSGQIVQEAPPTELLHNPSDPFVAKFLRAQQHSMQAALESDR